MLPALDLGVGGRLLQPLAGAGDDRDDAGLCVRPVDAGLRSADHLDALDVVDGEIGEIKIGVGNRIHLDAVDQDKDVIGLVTADAHLRERAASAGLVDLDTGHEAQRLGHGRDVFLPQLLPGDHRDAGTDPRRLHRRLAGRNHDLRQFDGLAPSWGYTQSRNKS
jgi:hypothetical protein